MQKARKRNKSHPDWKGGNKTVPICRPQKTLRTKKVSLVKSQEAKSRARNQLYFHTLAMKRWKLKINTIYNHIRKKKFVGINLSKKVKDLFAENYKTLAKQTKGDSRKWKDTP